MKFSINVHKSHFKFGFAILLVVCFIMALNEENIVSCAETGELFTTETDANNGTVSLQGSNDYKPDVRNTVVDFGQFYGQHPDVMRGMPGFYEHIYSEDSGEFRFYTDDTQLVWLIEVGYRNNTINWVYLNWYSEEESFGSNMRVWGCYVGMPAGEAEARLAEHGFGCFYSQPNYGQWAHSDEANLIVQVGWDSDGTFDQIAIQPYRR